MDLIPMPDQAHKSPIYAYIFQNFVLYIIYDFPLFVFDYFDSIQVIASSFSSSSSTLILIMLPIYAFLNPVYFINQ